MYGAVNTVSAYRSLLKEDDYELKLVGVKKLLENISTHWTDIADDYNEIEALVTDSSFPDPQLASILMAKLLFYLSDYDRALDFALLSGLYFQVTTENDDFTDILANKCIQKYIHNTKNNVKDQNRDNHDKIVQFLIQNAFDRNEHKLPLGIALQTADLNLFKKILDITTFNILVDAIIPSLNTLQSTFKQNMLASLFSKAPNRFQTPKEYLNYLQLIQAKGDFDMAAKLVYDCLKSDQIQIAFTLALQISEMHGFNKKVQAALPIEQQHAQAYKQLCHILDGSFTSKIHNVVLSKIAKTDPHYQSMLKNIQSKSSISHGSAIVSLSFLQAYTQNHSFLESPQNLSWASRATHWNKFTSVASLGLIYKNTGNQDCLKNFMPGIAADPATQYANGGALYGLGLLSVGTNNSDLINYYINIMGNPGFSQNDVIMHGASLGLGIVSFASGNDTVGDKLKDVLNSSTSVMGQASALALGLTYAGTNNDAIISQLIGFAQDTQYQKIIRSICMSIGLISFRAPSKTFLNNLQSNPALKNAVPFYAACAYFQTADPIIVRKLLNLSNDISNQVKRSALIALGFVLYQNPKLIDLIKLMLYSYNPHIRYGCAMALGIGARDNKDTIDLLWPLLTDHVDFVRQGAYVSMSLILQLLTAQAQPKVAQFRKMIDQILGRQHGQIMAKMGAILSVGLLDMGGRNMTVSLTTRCGFPKIEAVAGMIVFSQFWNWFPYLLFLGLSMSPSAYIGITNKFNIPVSLQIKSNAKPSMFDYPPNLTAADKKSDNKKDTAKQLSITMKAKARAIRKKDGDAAQQQVPPLAKKQSLLSKDAPQASPVQEKPKGDTPVEVPKVEQQTFAILSNPVRILEKQRKYLSFVQGRFVPLNPTKFIGISFVKDTTPDQTDNWFYQDKPKPVQPIAGVQIGAPMIQQMQPPQDFEYNESANLLPK